MYFYLQLIPLLLCGLTTLADGLFNEQIYPGIFIIQNSALGLHQNNHFTVTNFEYRYMAIYIDDYKLPRCDIVETSHQDSALTELDKTTSHTEIFVRSFRFPLLESGKHDFCVVLSNHLEEPPLKIHVDMICDPMLLLHDAGAVVPNVCYFDFTSDLI